MNYIIIYLVNLISKMANSIIFYFFLVAVFKLKYIILPIVLLYSNYLSVTSYCSIYFYPFHFIS